MFFTHLKKMSVLQNWDWGSDLWHGHCRIWISHEGKRCRIFLIKRLREIVLFGYCVFSWYWLIFKMKFLILIDIQNENLLFDKCIHRTVSSQHTVWEASLWSTDVVHCFIHFWILNQSVGNALDIVFVEKIYCTDHQPLKCWFCNWTDRVCVYLVFK